MPKARDFTNFETGYIKVKRRAERLPEDDTNYWLIDCAACGGKDIRKRVSSIPGLNTCGCKANHSSRPKVSEAVELPVNPNGFLAITNQFYSLINRVRFPEVYESH